MFLNVLIFFIGFFIGLISDKFNYFMDFYISIN